VSKRNGKCARNTSVAKPSRDDLITRQSLRAITSLH